MTDRKTHIKLGGGKSSSVKTEKEVSDNEDSETSKNNHFLDPDEKKLEFLALSFLEVINNINCSKFKRQRTREENTKRKSQFQSTAGCQKKTRTEEKNQNSFERTSKRSFGSSARVISSAELSKYFEPIMRNISRLSRNDISSSFVQQLRTRQLDHQIRRPKAKRTSELS